MLLTRNVTGLRCISRTGRDASEMCAILASITSSGKSSLFPGSASRHRLRKKAAFCITAPRPTNALTSAGGQVRASRSPVPHVRVGGGRGRDHLPTAVASDAITSHRQRRARAIIDRRGARGTAIKTASCGIIGRHGIGVLAVICSGRKSDGYGMDANTGRI